MNNVFNLRRFSWLLRKNIMERPVQLLGLILLVIALEIMIYAFCKAVSGFDLAQSASFVLGLTGGGCFLASFVYSHFATNASGSSYLTLPASAFEKWLCGVLITGIVYTAIFLLFYKIMDTVFISFYHKNLDPNGPFYKELYDAVQPFQIGGFVASRTYIMFFNFAGCMLIGTLYFNKSPFIKVALLVCGICFGAFLINLLMANMFFKDVNSAFPYFFVYVTEGNQTGRLELPAKTLRNLNIVFEYILPSVLWLLALLRLKEKEF